MDDLTGRVAAFGPFFEFGVHAAGTSPAPPWRGMDELLADPLSHVMLVRTRLAAASGREPTAVEVRVAASVAHLGLVARLVAPFLGAAALAGEPPLARPLGIPPDIWWQPERGGAFPLSLSEDALSEDALSEDALSEDALSEDALSRDAGRPAGVVRLLEGPVQELSEAFARLRVSPLILRGNVASAINGAATAITRAAPAQPAGRRALTIAVSLYEHPALRGAATVAPDGTSFRRRSCCLIYRAAPGALCGDCILRPR